MFQNQQARICLLYLPLLELLYQNLKQLSAQPYTSSPGLGLNVSPLGILDVHSGVAQYFEFTNKFEQEQCCRSFGRIQSYTFLDSPPGKDS